MVKDEEMPILKKLERFKKSFILELKSTNKSKHTISSYSNTIFSFIEYIRQYEYLDTITLKNIKKSTIIEFFEYKNENLEKQGEISAKTKVLLLAHLKTFFKHIESESDELYDFSKILEIKIVVPKVKPKGLINDEVVLLKNYLERIKLDNTYISYRNSLIIKLMLCGGLRKQEVIDIKLSDFIYDDKLEIYTLTVIGKGRKEREIFIKKYDIEDELDELKRFNNKYLCVTRTDKRMDGSEVYRAVTRIYSKINIKASVHDLRHTYAKRLAESNVPLPILQQLLGHSSLETTSIYLNPTRDNIINSIINS